MSSRDSGAQKWILWRPTRQLWPVRCMLAMRQPRPALCPTATVAAANTWSCNAFGFGSNFQIDTHWPFTVSTTFPIGGDGQLVAVSTTLRVLPPVGGYFVKTTAPLRAGMVPTMSVSDASGDDMTWLDTPPCPKLSCAGHFLQLPCRLLGLKWA